MQQKQRVYLIENDSKYYYENAFQKDQYNYNDDDYQSQKKKTIKKIFLDQHEHEYVFHKQHEHVFYEQSSYNEVNNVINNIINAFDELDVRFFFIEASKVKFNCRRCNEIFLFNNKLYYHFKRCKKFAFKTKVFRNLKSKVFFNFIEIKIIRSFAFINFTSEFDFKF